MAGHDTTPPAQHVLEPWAPVRTCIRRWRVPGVGALQGTTVDKEKLLVEIKRRLQAAHGERLRGVVLYGSHARGEASAESDIDVLVLLDEPVDYGEDLETNLDALYPLALELSRRISAKPVSAKQYETVDCPLYRNARRDGTAA